jgi:AcrR family transcriptional regulator
MGYLTAPVRREQLVTAAVTVMAREGVRAATTRAVAREAGVPLSTVHYLFGTKAAMLRVVIETLTDDVVAGFSAAQLRGRNLRNVLDSMVDVCWRGVHERPQHHLLLLELTTYALREPGLHEVAVEQYARYLDAIDQMLRRVYARAGVDVPADNATLARLMLAGLDGFTLQQLVDDDPQAIRAGLTRVLDSVEDAVRRAPPATRRARKASA